MIIKSKYVFLLYKSQGEAVGVHQKKNGFSMTAYAQKSIQ